MSRSYCFTINNYTLEEIDILENITCRYLIYGLEVGDAGTPHIQGYIELGRVERIASLRLKMGGRAHLEVRRGTREAARQYCMKEGEYIEKGDWAAGGQGRRNDIRSLITHVKEELACNRKGITKTLIEDLPELYSRHQRMVEKYIAICDREETKEFRHVQVEVLIGDAGTGKTRSVHERESDVFTVNPEDNFPFDGYNGESAILIDDFEGQLKYKHLLKILDGHQLRVNVKGSHCYARWTKVFITTNEIPESWYQRGMTPALKRRLHTVTWFGNEEAGNTVPPLDI